jgi:hypothetical protein
MSAITETLHQISQSTLRDIDMSYSSIYKINKEHRLFILLLQENSELSAAEYIVYPNINNNLKTIFLDSSGEEVLVYNKGVSEFILLPADFELTLSHMRIDNPYHQNFSI